MLSRDRSLAKTCREFEEDLVLHYYGEGGEMERKKVEGHLRGCLRCRDFFADLHAVLPFTDHEDDPPEAFWEQYAIEMRRKLAAVEPRDSWWRRLCAVLAPRPLVPLATACGLVLALILAFSGEGWFEKQISKNEFPRDIQAVAGGPEFFKAMELMEVLDLLEALETKNGKLQAA